MKHGVWRGGGHLQVAAENAKVARRLEVVGAETEYAKAEASAAKAAKVLEVATARVLVEWKRVDNEWLLAAKGACLEACHANARLHEQPTADLLKLKAAIEADQVTSSHACTPHTHTHAGITCIQTQAT